MPVPRLDALFLLFRSFVFVKSLFHRFVDFSFLGARKEKEGSVARAPKSSQGALPSPPAECAKEMAQLTKRGSPSPLCILYGFSLVLRARLFPLFASCAWQERGGGREGSGERNGALRFFAFLHIWLFLFPPFPVMSALRASTKGRKGGFHPREGATKRRDKTTQKESTVPAQIIFGSCDTWNGH